MALETIYIDNSKPKLGELVMDIHQANVYHVILVLCFTNQFAFWNVHHTLLIKMVYACVKILFLFKMYLLFRVFVTLSLIM